MTHAEVSTIYRNGRIEVPQIDICRLPEGERKVAWLVQNTLLQLALRMEDFQAALELFDFCASHIRENLLDKQFALIRNYTKWQLLSARDGAMTLYHFGRTIRYVGNLLKGAPVLKGEIEHSHLRAARRLMHEKFPHVERVRHAVAHSAELTESEEKFDANAFTGTYDGQGIRIKDGSSIFVSNNLDGRTYTTGHEGEILTYSLAEECLIALTDIANLFYLGFTRPNIPLA